MISKIIIMKYHVIVGFFNDWGYTWENYGYDILDLFEYV